MPNPLEDYLSARPQPSEKLAAFPMAPSSMRIPLQQAAGALGRGALESAAAAGTVGLIGAAGKAYSAITKRRDFRAMLEVAPDLAAEHTEDPVRLNRYYDSVRRTVPQYASDPYLASHLVRQMSGAAHPGFPLFTAVEKSRPQAGTQLGMEFGPRGPSFSVKT